MQQVSPRVPVLVRTILVAALVAGLAPALAQDATPSEDPLVTQARELVESLEEIERQLTELRAEEEKAEGEDKLLKSRQVADREIEAFDEVGALCDNVVEQESAGLDASEFREMAESWLKRITSRLPGYIEQREGELDELRAGREGLDPADVVEFEKQVNVAEERIAGLYEVYLAHVGRLDSIGLDSASARADLAERIDAQADDLAARVGLAREQLEAVRERAAAEPGNTDVQVELLAGELKLDGSVAGLEAAVGIMQALDLETAEYQKLLIETTGEITTDVLDTDVAFSLMQQWGSDVQAWVADNGPGIIFKTLLFVGILVFFRIVAGVVRKVLRRAVSSSRLSFSQLLQDMIVKIGTGSVIILGILVALSQIGVSLGPLLAGLGIVGFILGFALQDTLANFASGIMILIYKPYDVGDVVDATGVFGKVSKMSLVSTTILTLDHQTLIVPNSKIWGDVIKNVTAEQVRRVDMVFGVSYTDDIPKVESVLKSILAEHDRVLDDPEPMVRLHNLGESSVDFVVRPWVKTDDYWDVYWDVTREVKMRFDREGIGIPFPQRDVHIYQAADSPPEES